ncbi:MAG: C-terminal binding protein [Candidatus Rokubacteria bacterium]|nr:C-terminal binding protein [Candidatus Rokubacteria bacterium]
MAFEVLVTDYAWPSLATEARVLAEVGAGLIVAETGEEAELVRLAPAADAILTTWKRVGPAVLDAAPRCRIVSRYGVGVDNIAVDHATSLGIVVTNVPDYCAEEVSDHAMALLLACARRVVTFATATRRGVWDVRAGRPIPRLRGQTLGLVGFGRNARALAPKAAGFGLRILAYDPWVPADAVAPFGTLAADLETLLRESDYVSLHVPLTPETRSLIDARTLRLMKPTAYLVNTARGPIVDEAALHRALTEGWIAGAGLDVLATEPAAAGHPLLALENVIVTPHAAFYSEASIEELTRKAAERVVAVLRGELPPCIMNPAVLQRPGCRVDAARAPSLVSR